MHRGGWASPGGKAPQACLQGVSGGAPGQPRCSYLASNVDLPAAINFMAVQSLLLNQVTQLDGFSQEAAAARGFHLLDGIAPFRTVRTDAPRTLISTTIRGGKPGRCCPGTSSPLLASRPGRWTDKWVPTLTQRKPGISRVPPLTKTGVCLRSVSFPMQPSPDYCVLECERFNSPLYCNADHPQDLPNYQPYLSTRADDVAEDPAQVSCRCKRSPFTLPRGQPQKR